MSANEEKRLKTKDEVSFKDSIKTKMILVMMLVAAVPLIIAVGISYLSSTNKDKTDALSILNSDARFAETQFLNVVQENVIALETFATSPSTIKYVKEADTPNPEISDELIMAHMDKINEDINDGNKNVILTRVNGDQLLRTDRKELVNNSDRDYFQNCVSSKGMVASDIVVSRSAGNRITLIVVPVIDDETGEVIATAQRSFDLIRLHEFLAEYIEDGYIADRTGTVAAHATHEITAEDEPEVHSDAEYMTSSAESGIFQTVENGQLKYTCWIKEPTTGYYVAVSKKNSDIMASARRSALTIVIIGIVLLIIADVVSIVMAKSFADPIKAVSVSLAALADGRFEKVEKYDVRKDEFGQMSKATNSLIETLGAIVGKIKNSAHNVGSSAEELSEMANQISRTTEDVSRAVQEIASGATQQADEIQQATENVEKIGDAIGNVKTSTDDLSGIADKMKNASESSSRSLSSLQDSSSEMTAKIDEISKTIQATQTAVNNISEKVEGITSIATQTNLLSLNASIEAARAGETGRGFAVVAEEIGTLAENSKQMADDIRKEMNVLLAQAKAAVVAAEDVRQGNSDQQTALGETLESVDGMLEDIGNTVEGVKLIADGAETCDSSKGAVVDTMSALSAISEENAASSEETGASMEELSATVTNLAESASSLSDIAVELNEEMKFFK
ncbi:methyl-accepting chemotaxis protein [Lachnospiraceae bacterium]|nr:methyl-accepting chemotaxis protein [Lachnospiraceae bacterium]